MNLSEHFTLAEMTDSQTAVRKGIDNDPGTAVVHALTTLCVQILEPLRAHYGLPVRISSGYRSPALNAAIGGASASQHVLGEAADITVPGIDNLALARWIRDHLPFDQVIMEGRWVHVSCGPRNRRQALTAHFANGRARYSEGLA
jgi:hypothetical protein